ncbi:hypothetical protein [Streptomyces alfalfae]|uniref:Uncharacterized protein n=1 Tax=Streptomyces alfalfae TaxID=1642299 RepID=A0A7T4TW71_9ACTN|nr:hypothetical protein [Streptomyces alfalfae]QQC87363.1 hypothetical protein I8755_02270 [Streptomyces alfalfae]QUI29796.1 hypothetical protein H9W91_02175 [Streptomyces alfalfae]
MAPRLAVLLTACAAAAATVLPVVSAHEGPAAGQATVTSAAPAPDVADATPLTWAWD